MNTRWMFVIWLFNEGVMFREPLIDSEWPSKALCEQRQSALAEERLREPPRSEFWGCVPVTDALFEPTFRAPTREEVE